MKRIILHWTAGMGKPNAHEKECYHYLIDKDGIVHEGRFKPEDNLNCYDGRYAMHTGGGNTGSIGVAVCGCAVPSGVNVRLTKYPLTKVQIERLFSFTAELCKRYGIVPTANNVMTHYEFGKKNPKTSSKGKIDLTELFVYKPKKGEEGNFIRGKIRWYLSKINNS